MGVSVLIPTRSRPKRFKTAVDSLLQNKTGEVEIVSYVDDDDPVRDQYPNPTIVGPRGTLARAILDLVNKASFSYLFLGADDVFCKTKGWDEKLVQAMPADCIGLAYGDDGRTQNCNHFMFHQKWVSLTGFFPDDFEHFGPDTYVGKVAENLGRKILVKSVLIEHHHPKFGTAPQDKTYADARVGPSMERDRQRLKNYAERIERETELLRQHCL